MADNNELDARCPQCGKVLEKVRYPSSSMFNRDQWESMRAGDYVCNSCPDNGRGKSGHCYFWQSELNSVTAPPTPADKFDDFADEVLQRVKFFQNNFTKKDMAHVARQWFSEKAATPADKDAREWLMSLDLEMLLGSHIGASGDYLCKLLTDFSEYRASPLEKEIRTLEDWKESAINVMNGIDLQAVGKALDLELGQSIGPNILPGILNLKQRLTSLTSPEKAREIADAVVEAIFPDLRNNIGGEFDYQLEKVAAIIQQRIGGKS